MKITLSHFIIAVLITSSFYISFHLSYWAGVLRERENQVCISAAEILKIKDDKIFFNKIHDMQEAEIDSCRKKLEKGTKDLSSCYNNNYKLKSVLSTPENEFTDEGKQIIN